MRAVLVVLVIVCGAAAAATGVMAQAAPKNDAPGAYVCEFQDKTDKGVVNYNLASLMNNDKDYTFTSTDGSVTLNYWTNPCRATISQVCGANSAICQQWDPNSPNGQANLGSTTTAKPMSGKLPAQSAQGGFTIEFVGGTSDPATGQARQMEIDFICDPKAGNGSPTYTNEDPKLHYNFQWVTAAACPVQNGLSLGSILLIIIACLIFVYIVGGILFMKFARKAEGIEILPNVEFWVSLPGLIKDGGLFIGSKTCCRNQAYGKV